MFFGNILKLYFAGILETVCINSTRDLRVSYLLMNETALEKICNMRICYDNTCLSKFSVRWRNMHAACTFTYHTNHKLLFLDQSPTSSRKKMC